jgi:glutaredoxin 3
MSRGLPPIELEWDPHPARSSSRTPPDPAQPSNAPDTRMAEAARAVSAAPPADSVRPIAGGVSAAPFAAVVSSSARMSIPSSSPFVEGARCTKHGLWMDAPGQCPRCRQPKQASAAWVYVAIGAVLSMVVVLFVVTRIRDAVSELRAANGPVAASVSQSGRERVVVYTTSSCPACRSAKNWLKANQVPYTELNIEDDNDAALEYRKLKVRVVPAIVVDGKAPMAGFSASQIQAALREPPPTAVRN